MATGVPMELAHSCAQPPRELANQYPFAYSGASTCRAGQYLAGRWPQRIAARADLVAPIVVNYFETHSGKDVPWNR
jgi:hypothetical protein